MIGSHQSSQSATNFNKMYRPLSSQAGDPQKNYGSGFGSASS